MKYLGKEPIVFGCPVSGDYEESWDRIFQRFPRVGVKNAVSKPEPAPIYGMGEKQPERSGDKQRESD